MSDVESLEDRIERLEDEVKRLRVFLNVAVGRLDERITPLEDSIYQEVTIQ
jgi:uncharacterized small protein (DUF1192 family)